MTYIAFLRGINVSGQKKIKMANLRLMLKGLGYSDVVTYIQSGNVVFKSEAQDQRMLESQITNAIRVHFGFEVPIVVKKRSEIQNILANNPYTNPEDLSGNKIYFVLLKEKPKQEQINVLSAISFDNEQLVITPTCVYLRCALGAGKAKCNNNLIEAKLKVSATSRNHRTMLKLLELAAD